MIYFCKETAFMPKKIAHFTKIRKWAENTFSIPIVLPDFRVNRFHFNLVFINNELTK